MHKGIVSIAHICTHQNSKLQISFNDACASVLNEYMRGFFLFFSIIYMYKIVSTRQRSVKNIRAPV